MRKSRERAKGFVVGVLVATILLSAGSALAASVARNISVTYRNIKIVVNGQQFTPRDSQGNIVEPFIYGGTTFLPLRAVGEAFGLDVEWDGNTSTVSIGEGGQGASSVSSNSLVGRWAETPGGPVRLEFFSSGAVHVWPGRSGEWASDGNRLSMSGSSLDGAWVGTYTFSISGNTLTLTKSIFSSASGTYYKVQ